MSKTLNVKAAAQAEYMTMLQREAQAQLQEQLADPIERQKIAFDPQGRVLIDVDQAGFWRDRRHAFLGFAPTARTTVSYDTTGTPLNEFFYTKLDLALSHFVSDVAIRQAILDALKERPKGSIIPLQQEFHFHLGLATRIYQQLKASNDQFLFLGKETELQTAYQTSLVRVNTLVINEFANALIYGMREGSLDIAKINQHLDKARKSITPLAHRILSEEIVQQTGVVLTPKQLKNINKIAEKTTATPNDVLHLERSQSLATLIKGSDETAHHRQLGRQFANRELITHAYEVNTIRPHVHPRIQIRTPSLAMKTALSEQQCIDDVVTKLNAVKDTYKLTSVLQSEDEIPKAFIYNLYTASNDSLDELFNKKNKQTQSARHILKGAHQYNLQQMNSDSPEDAVFCFIQAISVNGFGAQLGYKRSRLPAHKPLANESTLMSEMALIHSLYKDATTTEQHCILDAMNLYRAYLTTPNKKEYFSQSTEGARAITAIHQIKQSWKQTDGLNAEINDEMHVTRLSLKKLMAHDLHYQHKFSKLIQTLSVFIEKASLGGCKSGNERAQSINGRVALLDAMVNSSENKHMDIKNALYELAIANTTEVIAKALLLKAALDKAYNATNLHGAASLISLIDQGASSKVEAQSQNISFNRNYAEEHQSVLSNLHQTQASNMQAHKNLSTAIKLAWGCPVSWKSRIKNSPLGVFGSIATFIFAPLSLGAGLAVGLVLGLGLAIATATGIGLGLAAVIGLGIGISLAIHHKRANQQHAAKINTENNALFEEHINRESARVRSAQMEPLFNPDVVLPKPNPSFEIPSLGTIDRPFDRPIITNRQEEDIPRWIP